MPVDLKFEKDYFINSNTSNYIDYREKKYESLAKELIDLCGITPDEHIIDFGCAIGLLIKEFTKLGYKNLKGTDISYWAIEYGKRELGLENELQYHNINLLVEIKDHVLFLDVLEHIPDINEIKKIIDLAKKNLRKSIIIRVPTTEVEGGEFVLPASKSDKTHYQIHSKDYWLNLLNEHNDFDIKYLNGKHIFDGPGCLAIQLTLKRVAGKYTQEDVINFYNSASSTWNLNIDALRMEINDYFLGTILSTCNTILDLGCGGGAVSNYYATRGFTVTGVDISPKMIERAKQRYALPNLYFYVGDMMVMGDNWLFDLVILCDSLEHVLDMDMALHHALRMVKMDGYIYITIPHPTYRKNKGLENQIIDNIVEIGWLKTKLSLRGFTVVKEKSYGTLYGDYYQYYGILAIHEKEAIK